ncbi:MULTISPECIES: hypothetical protein [unclassified Massilia]|uniref:hypothetical protein n=1 Tax=unclassified Massilia TaxID=2609279 RepID=UPI0017852472|nr:MULTISPECIES: hypothetical protein [unclassified Massilia]MBD8530383.1 hypothetical protein [Massilia sp. CFBP 13647]MBD8673160.1 hypothetical protein [Massilia sp. CFBP 13721]
MRRVFVIFLILLFPLNVLALSTSVASLQHTAVTHEASAFTNSVDLQTLGDPDADEPPAGYDFHDSMNEEGRLQAAVLPGRLVSPPSPARRGLAPFPPIKPPPV